MQLDTKTKHADGSFKVDSFVSMTVSDVQHPAETWVVLS